MDAVIVGTAIVLSKNMNPIDVGISMDIFRILRNFEILWIMTDLCFKFWFISTL